MNTRVGLLPPLPEPLKLAAAGKKSGSMTGRLVAVVVSAMFGEEGGGGGG